jgi:[protein-PII] uridylyltransferase
MLVIRNMRRFHYRSSEARYPVACHCVKNLPKIELLYIAGLFHDIAKGRGGDHSDLGAEDVIAFCRRHRLPEEDTALVAWLVKVHLLMSSTAQRKDIHDPAVVHEFATEVKTETRLDYLYALTVADINATNPTLWNAWRATLLRQLYMETRKALRRGLSTPVDRDVQVNANIEAAVERLAGRGIDRDRAFSVWSNPDAEFFLQHTTRQIVTITEALDRHDVATGPLVLVSDVAGTVASEGATEIVIYTRDQPKLFAASVIAMDQLGLSIHDARIHTSANALCFNTYIVLDETGQPLGADVRRKRHIREELTERLADPQTAVVQRRIPRRLKQFQRPTEAHVTNPLEAPHSVLEIVASDRPGLLARLGVIFTELEISVHAARITTLGERVEDVFFISGRDGRPLHDKAAIERLTTTIRRRLDQDMVEPRAEAGS